MVGRALAIALFGVVSVLPSAACQRSSPLPAVPEVSAPPPAPTPPPAPIPVADARDAAADAVSGADGGDNHDAGPSAHPGRGKKQSSKSRGGGEGAAGGVKVEGGLSAAEATAVVRGGRGRLQACFDEAVAANPKLSGRVAFRLTVDERGRVTLGEVITSTLGGDDPEMCMIRATRSFKFPASPVGGVVGFQMVFGK